MIFTILRAYAELSHRVKAGDRASERTTILCIEEPELYLHPHFQRTFMSTLRQIAGSENQVIYSTQSNYFVNVAYFDEVCVMRRIQAENGFESYPTQLSIKDLIEDLKVRKGVDASEGGIREQYYNAFNLMVNEGFFADKVIIVEGPSERYSLPYYSLALRFDLDRNNIAIVQSDGKGQMDRLLRVFNGFKIPTYVIFDGDKENSDPEVKRKTLELLELLGKPVDRIEDVQTMTTDSFTVFEKKFEVTLGEEFNQLETLLSRAVENIGPCGKPLKHRFVARMIKDCADNADLTYTVPATIELIIEKIRDLSYSGSILRNDHQSQ